MDPASRLADDLAVSVVGETSDPLIAAALAEARTPPAQGVAEPRKATAKMPAKLWREPSVWGLTTVAVVWTAWIYLQVWRRHDRFGTFDNDLGFHSQYIWQIAHGRWFSTILGLHAFGHNSTFGYLLLAPLSWFGGGPHTWNFIQTASLASGAFAVFSISRRRLGTPGLGAAMGVIWLLQPVVQGNAWETFHPESMAMAPLLFAYNAADQRRWRRFAAWAFLAIIWKADVALFLAVLALVFAWKQRLRPKDLPAGWTGGRSRMQLRNARRPLAIFALSLVWFFVCMNVMIPRLSGGGTVFGGLYGRLGDSPSEVVINGLRHPTWIAERVGSNDAVKYGRDLLTPLALSALGGPEGLLIGLPQIGVSLLAERQFTHDPFGNPHYQALTATALMIGSIEAMSRLRRRRPTALIPAIAIIAAFGLATTASWGALPSGVRRNTFWVPPGDPSKTAKRAAVEFVGPDSVVSATYLLVPHLAEREGVYSFPNPWRQVFYGVVGTPPPNPRAVQFLIVDLQILSEGPDRELYDCLMTVGSFREASRGAKGQIIVSKRVQPTSEEQREQFRLAEDQCAHPAG